MACLCADVKHHCCLPWKQGLGSPVGGWRSHGWGGGGERGTGIAAPVLGPSFVCVVSSRMGLSTGDLRIHPILGGSVICPGGCRTGETNTSRANSSPGAPADGSLCCHLLVSQAARKLMQGLTLAWKALDIASAAGGESGRRFSSAAAPPSPLWLGRLIRVTDGPDRPLTVSNVLRGEEQAQLFRCCCLRRPHLRVHFRYRRLPPPGGSTVSALAKREG